MANNVNFTQLANILEKDIIPAVYNQLYKKALLWEVFSGFKAEEESGVRQRVNTPGISFKNNQVYMTIQNGRPVISGVATNGGEKFTYGQTPTDQGVLAITTTVGAFIMPKSVMNIKEGGDIIDKMQFNINSTTNSMAMDLSRQCYSDGTSTIAYAAASGTSSTTVTLAPKASSSALYNNDIPLAIRYFAVGLPIQIGANAATTVTAITGSNTITIAAAQTWSAQAAIVKLNDSGSVLPSMTGLIGMVDSTSTYMTISPSSDATWAAYTNTNGGSAKTYASGDWDIPYASANATGDVSMIMANQTEFIKYGQSLVNNVRFNVEYLSGGWKALDYMGGNAAVILDYDCPDDSIFGLSPDHLFRAEYQPLEFEVGNFMQGMRLQQQLDYEIVADIMGNIGTSIRSAHFKLTNRVG